MESSMEVPEKTKIWSSNPIPGQKSRHNYNSKYTCILMFKAALLTIAKTWRQPKCPLIDERIKTMWCRYTISIHIYYEVLSLSCVRLFVTPRTAAHQSSLSFTIAGSFLKLMSTDLVMQST